MVRRSDILGSKRVLRATVVKRSDILGCEGNIWRLFVGDMREVILWGFLLFTLLYLWKRNRVRRVRFFGLRVGLREGEAAL